MGARFHPYSCAARAILLELSGAGDTCSVAFVPQSGRSRISRQYDWTAPDPVAMLGLVGLFGGLRCQGYRLTRITFTDAGRVLFGLCALLCAGAVMAVA